MSKMSRKKANKRRRRNKKRKNAQSSVKQEKMQLRTVAYLLEDDARDFFENLCQMNINDLIKIKYRDFTFDDVIYTRISIYSDNNYAHKAFIIASRQFDRSVYVVQYKELSLKNISDKNLCLVGKVVPDTIDQFRDDAMITQVLCDSEILSYQVPNSTAIIVEIYTNDVNREFALAVLDDGWMSEKWGKCFKQIPSRR